MAMATAAPAPLGGRRLPSGADWRLVTRAGIDLLAVDVALRLGGLRRAMGPAGALAFIEARRPVGEGERERAARYARWIGAVARRHAVRARCLHRALVLHRWLRAEGLPSELRIGVRKAGGALLAHAWVELAGTAVGEPAGALAAYTPLPNLDTVIAAGKGGWQWS